MSKEQKIQLAFVAYILSKLQKEKPVSGIIVGCDSKASAIKLEMFYKEICAALKHIKTWIKKSNSELPDIFINKHCH